MIESLTEFFSSQFRFSVVLAVAVLVGILTAVAYCILAERKLSAWIQDRHGPNRVGPWGLLQPIADGVKFLIKEDIIPGHVDRPMFILAPTIIFLVAFVGFAVIPWGGSVDLDGDGTVDVVAQVANPDIGLLYMLGVAGVGVYGVVLGGWVSNNKYSFYGGMRAAAQMLSYEIPMGLAILVVVLTTGQLRLEEIVAAQMGEGNTWIILRHPVAFGVLLITAFAEANRLPFDLAEAEQELVGGYHTEYSSMKFAMFFLAEYAHMITASAFMTVLFFGGWHLPFVPWCQPEAVTVGAMLVKILVMAAKVAAFIGFFMWVRWTIPRFRFDQLMRLAWKGLVPLSMGLVATTAALVYFGRQDSVAWSLAAEAVVVVLVLGVIAVIPTPVTGRQANMPRLARHWPAAPPAVGGAGGAV